ncbi:MAG: DUF5989 family protein [Candidatus Sulfotelmatobacter sp.]
MKFVKNIARNMNVAGELGSYFGGRRWWMLPIIASILLLGVFIIVAQSSSLAPFIYTFF